MMIIVIMLILTDQRQWSTHDGEEGGCLAGSHRLPSSSSSSFPSSSSFSSSSSLSPASSSPSSSLSSNRHRVLHLIIIIIISVIKGCHQYAVKMIINHLHGCISLPLGQHYVGGTVHKLDHNFSAGPIFSEQISRRVEFNKFSFSSVFLP